MKIISLGLGVQSTALYMMSSLKRIDRADHAIFADPSAELPQTYKILNLLKDWKNKNNGIPIHITDKKNIYKDLLNQKNGKRLASIPAFTKNGGMIRRQCTNEYKIQPVIKKARQLHGLKPRQRMPMTEMWLGITIDEIERAKISQLPRITYHYPLINQRMDRADCMRFFEEINFPIPPKSSCVFCPYHSNKTWKNLKDNHPKEFKKAIKIDSAIRDMKDRGLDEPVYLHRTCTPLERVEFADQLEMFMCEEGFCGL
tara:strand:- start:2686 stop:3456 length:771 start_codon:yes stop_codon:yes gene_type:complete